ncbi:MAG: transglutaminase-like domain-containing protein [Bacteroidales bacterium]|nr:transglutaminase-like domain-containing protein [Bacteroidales bacterium]
MSDLISKIKLLDDPDERIYQSIRESIINDGLSAIPLLEEVWGNEPNPLLQERIEEIIHTIQFTDLKRNFQDWKSATTKDIIYGAYLVAKYVYADLQWEKIEKYIDKIKKDVWLELNQNLTALEKINLLNYIFFHLHGFSVTNSNTNLPQNYLINHVIETKRGNDLCISVLYIGIAQRLNIPVFGVNFPKNFLVCFVDHLSAFEAFGDTTNSGVLFYMTPRGNGTVFGLKELDYFLNQAKIKPLLQYYLPMPNLEVVKEIVRNLIASYEQLANTDKVNELKQILQILS